MDATALLTFKAHLHAALDAQPAETRRLFHGRGRRWPGLEQLTADWLDGQLLVSLFREPSPEFLNELQQLLTELIASPSGGTAAPAPCCCSTAAAKALRWKCSGESLTPGRSCASTN
ncbi:class I SAM-dependent methyltransferase [Oceanimonas sp. NS1]|nr:class I SAM-dependent methyltransferase [Oceanimonas sp. NS1]